MILFADGVIGKKLTSEYVRDYLYKNGFILLDENYINNNTKLHIKDFDGYQYDYKFQYFSPSIEPAKFYYKNPYTEDNIKLWLILNNKPFVLIENQTFNRNNDVLYFKCLNCHIDENPFKSCWNEIQQGKGCGICEGRQIGKYNNLKYLRPDIAREWIKSEHNLSSKDVTKGSRENVYWECFECGNKWWNKVSDRVYKNSGCLVCSGKIVSNKNRLSTLYSKISSEWHPIKKWKFDFE